MQRSKHLLVSGGIGFLMIGVVLAGCGDATNAPSADAVQKANDDRRAAIDNDPKMSPADKEKMKEMMGLSKGGAQAAPGGPGNPAAGR
jgi:hypothetical protein